MLLTLWRSFSLGTCVLSLFSIQTVGWNSTMKWKAVVLEYHASHKVITIPCKCTWHYHPHHFCTTCNLSKWYLGMPPNQWEKEIGPCDEDLSCKDYPFRCIQKHDIIFIFFLSTHFVSLSKNIQHPTGNNYRNNHETFFKHRKEPDNKWISFVEVINLFYFVSL